MNNEALTLEKQSRLWEHMKGTAYSRIAFSAFKTDGVDHNSYVPRLGMTLGHFFTTETVAKTR